MTHGSAKLQVKRVQAEQHLARRSTGALASVLRRQQEKEVVWMRGLLRSLQVCYDDITALKVNTD